MAPLRSRQRSYDPKLHVDPSIVSAGTSFATTPVTGVCRCRLTFTRSTLECAGGVIVFAVQRRTQGSISQGSKTTPATPASTPSSYSSSLLSWWDDALLVAR